MAQKKEEIKKEEKNEEKNKLDSQNKIINNYKIFEEENKSLKDHPINGENPKLPISFWKSFFNSFIT